MINPNFKFEYVSFCYFKEDPETSRLFSEVEYSTDGLVYSKDGSICLPNCTRKKDSRRGHDFFIWEILDDETDGEQTERKEILVRPGVETIYDGAFCGINNAVIVIPESVEIIGAAFQFCKDITLRFQGFILPCNRVEEDAFFHSSNISIEADFEKNNYFRGDSNCYLDYNRLLAFSSNYVKESIPFITGDNEEDQLLPGIICIPEVMSINKGILHDAAIVDARKYRGEKKDLIDGFYFDGDYESYWDKRKCRYVVVNEKLASILPEKVDWLKIVDLERYSSDIIGLIDYDKRFQSYESGNITYSPHLTRAIKAARSIIMYDHRYQMPDPYINGKEADIKYGTKVICDYAFAMWKDLEEITIPPTVVKIGAGAFYGCNNLRNIVIPEGVEVIEEDTFAECHWLERVSLPKTLIEIRESAFRNCSSLNEIVIPESVSICDERAFEGCLIEKCSGPEKIIVEYDDSFYKDRHWDVFFPKWNRKEHLKAISQFSYNNLLIRENAFYIFVDTETSGLPINSSAPSYDIDNWPHLVQLGWIVTNHYGDVLSSNNRFVFPVDYEIEEEAIKVHHITTENARKYGEPLIAILEDFIIDLRSAAFIVGHNIDFDKKIIGAEMVRCGMPDIIGPSPSIDTMKIGLQFTDLKDVRGRHKNPKLTELYSTLFGIEQRNAHDALGDVKATLECFFEMKSRLYNSSNVRVTKGKLSRNKALMKRIVSARLWGKGVDSILLIMEQSKGVRLKLDLEHSRIGDIVLRIGMRVELDSIEVIDCVVEDGKRVYVASLNLG